MTRRVRTALSPVLRPVLALVRRYPLLLPGSLFVLVLGVGLSGLGRPAADAGRRIRRRRARLAGGCADGAVRRSVRARRRPAADRK